MRWTFSLVIVLIAARAGAADLSAVDRTIRAEPAYAGTPRYCLLVFGPEAHQRVWLVHDGDTLYVDRNGNGDLTDPGEGVAATGDLGRDAAELGYRFEIGELRVGGCVHTGLTLIAAPLARPNARAARAAPVARVYTVALNVDRPELRGAGTDGRVRVTAGPVDGSGPLVFADKWADAPIIHLDGPLQATLHGEKPTLMLERATEIMLAVGTPGLGAGTFATLADGRAVPATATARVEIAFPPAKAGGASVRKRFDLTGRSWGYNRHGPVRPPPDAGVGDAVITVTVDRWEGARVAGATQSLTVTRPKDGVAEEPVSERLTRSLPYPIRAATVETVRLSADGSRLLAGDAALGVLQFWDVSAATELRRVELPPGYRAPRGGAMSGDWSALYVPWEKSTKIRLDRDGLETARSDYVGGVRVFDAADGRPRPSLKQPAGGVSWITASPDGRLLVTSGFLSLQESRHANRPQDIVAAVEHRAFLWDTRTSKAVPVAEAQALAAFSPDSRRLVVCVVPWGKSATGALKLLDADGTVLAEVAAAQGEVVYRPVISPDGKLVAVTQSVNAAKQPGVLRVFDMATLKESAAFPSGGDFTFTSWAFSQDGRRVAAFDDNGGVRVWDVAARKLVLTTPFGADMALSALAFSPDGQRLAVLGQPGWDRNAVAAEPDPRNLPQPRVFLFDLASPAAAPAVLVCPHGRVSHSIYGVSPMVYSPDGRTLAVGGTGAVHLFDMTDSRRRAAVTPATSP